VLGILILISGLSLLLDQKIQLHQRTNRILKPANFKRHQTSATTISGFILGTLVSATSIGAGAIGAMVLRTLYPLRMEPKKLVATDTVHAVPVSLLAGLGYLMLGKTNLELLAYLLAGSVPAVILGTKLLSRAPNRQIRVALSFTLLAAAIKLLLS
jgi:uncharacterized membrane protein YfcA